MMVYKIIILLYLIILVIGGIYDFKYRKIPNYIHLLVLSLCLINLNIRLDGLILSIILLSLVVFTKFKIGGGDIKFIGVTGLLFGLRDTILITTIGIFAMLIYYIIIKIIKRKCIKSLPFLPFLLIGNIPILLYNLLI